MEPQTISFRSRATAHTAGGGGVPDRDRRQFVSGESKDSVPQESQSMKRFARGMIAGLLVGLPLLVSPPVRASFIPIFNPSTSNPSAGTFVYTGSFTNSPNNDPTDPLRNGKPVE